VEQVGVVNEEAEWERQQLEEIDRALDILNRLQGAFIRTSELQKDLSQADGRRCILVISGLKHTQHRKFFEVSPSGVKLVEPYENPNTAILAPVDSVKRVLMGTLNGDTSAFAAEWARGQAKLVGERRIHDGYVFASVFSELASLVKRYRSM